MKFVVLKGQEGFADRLQCLLQVISYSKKTFRTIVIDWRDDHWCHSKKSDTELGIGLKDVETIELGQFLKIVGSKKMSIYPSSWEGKLNDQQFTEYIREPKYNLPQDNSVLNEIVSGVRQDFKEQIVVYPGIGKRTFNYSDIKHVILDKFVLDAIEDLSKKYSLQRNLYDVVHLRGGTKSWAGGLIRSNHPDLKKHNQWINYRQYISEIYEVYSKLLNGKQDLPLFLLTDTPFLARVWVETYGKGIMIPNSAHGLMGETGIHKISKDQLKDAALNKVLDKTILNTEALRDFSVMNNARILVGDGLSLFSLMAHGLKVNNQFICEMPPIRKSIREDQKVQRRLVKKWHF